MFVFAPVRTVESGALKFIPVRLLFIKLRHIGDALIMTPTLTAARRQFPDAEIWVVVRQGCEGILAGCPAIDRLLTAAPAEKWNRGLSSLCSEVRLAATLRQQSFDCAFELGDSSRGRWLAWLSGAKKLATDGSLRPLSRWWRRRFALLEMPVAERKQCHRARKDFLVTSQLLPLGDEVPPLCFARERTEDWTGATVRPPFVVFHPGTRWLRKRWPVAHWTELGRRLTALGFQIVISAGPDLDEVALAQQLETAIGAGTISTAGRANWRKLAGLLHRARLFVGVDTAAMHLAAACQCPTVAIFGPSKPAIWHPWRVLHRLVGPPGAILAEMRALELEEQERLGGTLTERVALDDVWMATSQLLQELTVAEESCQKG